jgi:hypothetical protein
MRMTDGDFMSEFLLTAATLTPDSSSSLVSAAKKLEQELGVNYFTKWLCDGTSINSIVPYPSEEWKSLLHMLRGPHGRTILKMYRIQKGLEA